MQIGKTNFTPTASTHSKTTPVIIMPAEAENLEAARDKMMESKDFFESVGISESRELMKSAALSGKISDSQKEQLEEAGFQVIEDKIVQRSATAYKSVKDMGPGWALDLFPLIGRPYDPFAPLRPERPAPMPQPSRQAVRPQGFEGPSDYVGELSATGKGVTIAVLDSGVTPHPDLGDRLIANVSAISSNRGYSIGTDPVGHGTHVAGDAAGDGTMSNGRLRGPAPDANIVGIQVLSEGADPAPLSVVMEEFTNGVEWMIQNKNRYGIRIANMSLGFPLQLARDRYTGARFLFDPIGAAVNQAVKSGIVVVAAAGNDGPRGQIDGSPGMLEDVITVGALDTNGTPEYKGDDRVADFSSRGLTPEGLLKPDIIAPGVNILAANSPGSMISEQNNELKAMRQMVEQAPDREIARMVHQMVRRRQLPPDALYLSPDEFRQFMLSGLEVKPSAGHFRGDSAYLAMDGTSMATPIVAGVIAAMLEVNPSLTPAQVKMILQKTADPLRGEPQTAQGAGAIDATEAIEVSRTLANRQARRRFA